MVKLHPLLTRPVHSINRTRGTDRPGMLLDIIPEKPEILKNIENHHIVSVRQFSTDLILQVFRLAALYESSPVLFHKPLAGKILISAFYEPSTRTRLSFESAWHRLGGDIMSITDSSTTGIAKGESLEDSGEMFNNYGDVVVLRDSSEDSVYRMLETLAIPIINAGNGMDEHPTQALTDLYTLFKWNPEIPKGIITGNRNNIQKIKIGIIGDPSRMRTVRSFLLLLTHAASAIESVTLINPGSNIFSPGQKEELSEGGLEIITEPRLQDVLPDLDAVYINSIAWTGDTFEKLAGDITLSSSSPLKPGSIVLHPLARGDELSDTLDATEHNWYFSQARSAVFLRMALLTCIVSRTSLVSNTKS